jgi:subtilisin family serine protease
VARINATLNETSWAPVLVSMEFDDANLSTLAEHQEAIKTLMRESVDRFAAEAPDQVEMGGHWLSPMGLAGFYVNAEGLERLHKTDLFDQVRFDDTRKERHSIANFEGQLDEVVQILRERKVAPARLVLELPELEYEIDDNGEARFDTSAGKGRQHNDAVAVFIDSLDPSWYVGRPAQPQGQDAAGPQVHINLTQRGYLALVDDERVRSLRLLSRMPRKPDVDSALEAAIESEGSARAWVNLADHAAYRSGLRDGDREAMVRAHQKAFERLQRVAGFEVLEGFEEYGTQLVQLDARGLAKLRQLPLVGNVRLDVPIAVPQLNNSTSAGAIGMPRIWSQGKYGTGQTIAILDTGIEKNHVFLKNHAGVSRVTYEACFGKNTANYKSPCPSPNASGDSPPGLVGSGAPANPTTYCASTDPDCSAHGTRVAGAAAGLNKSGVPTGVQGVAPDALLMAIQVFSFDKVNGSRSSFDEDYLGALNLVASRARGTSLDKYTVNMSFSDGKSYQGNCASKIPAIDKVVADLIALRVPVVAAAGNKGYRFGISFPACVPGVIKAAGSVNVGAGDVLSELAHSSEPSNIISETAVTGRVLMAPSYNVNTSALNGSFKKKGGTSLAAPQIAGYYAMIKSLFPGITVADIGAAMAYQPLYPTRVPLAKELVYSHPAGTIKLRRIQMP